jgi:hypothetical protein
MIDGNQGRVRRGEGDASWTRYTESTSISEPTEGSTAARDPGSERPEWMTEYDDYMRGFMQMVAQYPLASLVAGFGAGFGLGVLASAVWARGREEEWMQGNRLRQSLHDISSTLARLPHTIAEQLPSSVMRR